MRSIATEFKRLGVDHPDKGFVSVFTRQLSNEEKSRLRSEFRENLMYSQMKCCQITGSRIALVASHIKPFDHCADEVEAVTYLNGLLLRRDIDYLFDKGYISFDSKRRLMISSKIKEALGYKWAEQMDIALGKGAMKSWAIGGEKSKIKPLILPINDRFSGNTPTNLLKRHLKNQTKANEKREEYMDYHRRHIFKSPEIQNN